MKQEKKNMEVPGCLRREFLTRLPLAAAALTLSASFGFPINTEQTKGTIYIKLDPEIQRLSSTDFNNLRSGNTGSLNIKLSVSNDKINWKILSVSITDKNFLNQLKEITKNS
jgi:hypothetical protein